MDEKTKAAPVYRPGRVLFSEREISVRVRELAETIAAETRGGGLLVVGILNGAAIFLSDLARCMPLELDVQIDFMSISSYGSAAQTSGTVRVLKDLGGDIAGRDVLVVEDIIDTGLTLSYLLDMLKTRRPASLRTCVLLDKSARREVAVKVDYRGFTIPDAFVIGYGLDWAGKWRHLPDIRAAEPWAG
ncbi:MAG: hypoxanthine phosphoribosyltransferase [Synergistaceae bacterium]|nr:hypoxanthine phosphoribosyltransferase [Synergistaceae bacterium]